eukprot:4768064-Amphidinium_carterae.1
MANGATTSTMIGSSQGLRQPQEEAPQFVQRVEVRGNLWIPGRPCVGLLALGTKIIAGRIMSHMILSSRTKTGVMCDVKSCPSSLV